MKFFSNVLLISDLDGTLIGENFQIPQRNLDALKRFQEQGGQFAIATGRTIQSAQRYVSLTHPTAPCIILNGAAIYDYSCHKIVWDNPLLPVAKEYIRVLHEQFPTMGVEVCTEDMINIIQDNLYVQGHVNHENLKHVHCDLEHTQGRWYKGFFAMDAELLPQVQEYAEKMPHPGVRFVSSSDNYLELLPDGVNKGKALLKLMELQNISVRNTYAIGDYYNDLEMLSAAGTGVVSANAPDDIKKAADLVVCHCKDGAVADLIEYLEKTRLERKCR